jgi:hypothetical protein
MATKAALRERLEQFLKSTKKAGYEQVITHTLVRKNYMLPLAIMPNMEIAFNQSLPHMKEKSFTKTDELPSSL